MYVIVLVTCPDEKTAEGLSDAILNRRLAACVNTVSGMTSKYWWKGKLEKNREHLMIIKTVESRLEELEKTVKENHPYEVPEFIALPVTSGSKDYLGWLKKETGPLPD